MAGSNNDASKTAIDRIKDKSLRELLQSRYNSASSADSGAGAEGVSASQSPNTREDVINTAHAVVEHERKARMWSWLVVAIAVGLAVLTFWIFRSTDPDKLGEAGPGRPIIMLAMIVATVGFGGFLIVRAMFTEDPAVDLEKRFQMAREIFLVFSGIFATVVGFYFGSSDGRTPVPSAVSASTSLGAGGGISITLAGGAPPYAVALVGADKKKVMLTAEANDPAKFVVAPAVGVCPAGAVLEVSGANGAAYPDVALSYPVEQLRANGWKDVCKEPSPPVASGAASAAGSASVAAADSPRQ